MELKAAEGRGAERLGGPGQASGEETAVERWRICAFDIIGGEPVVRGSSRGCRAESAVPRPVPGEPASPGAVSEAPLGRARVPGRPVRR